MLKGCQRPLQGPPDVIGYQTCEQLNGLAREVQRIQRAQLSKLVELSQRVASSYHHPGHIHQLEISIQGCSATETLEFASNVFGSSNSINVFVSVIPRRNKLIEKERRSWTRI